MKAPKGIVFIAFFALILFLVVCAGLLKWRGFRASSLPSTLEAAVSRSVRDFADAQLRFETRHALHDTNLT